MDTAALGEKQHSLLGGTDIPEEHWPAVVLLGGVCSGLLVAPDLILYAAHCGDNFRAVTFKTPDGDRNSVNEQCVVHPDGGPGTGLDVAYCLLADPVSDVVAIPAAVDCEDVATTPGTMLLIVALGQEGQGLPPGNKKELSAIVVGEEDGAIKVVAGDNEGICMGDSGAPALLQMLDGTWRVAGIVSFTYEFECVPADGYVQDLKGVIGWLEDSSGRDLTPCYDGTGSWKPSPACRGFPLAVDDFIAASTWWSETCGPAYEPFPDSSGPDVLSIDITRADSVSWSVNADITEQAGSGVASVAMFSVEADQRSTGNGLRDDVPPFRFTVPEGRWGLRAEDWIGNVTEVKFTIPPETAQSGCGVQPHTTTSTSHSSWVLFLMLIATTAWRSRAWAWFSLS